MLKTNLKRILCLFLVFVMLASFAGVSFAETATDGSSSELTVTTKFYRYDDAQGEWVEADKVAPGEDVKARVFVETNYYAGAPMFLFFYNKDFFEDGYAKDTIIDYALNSETGSYADTYNVTANLVLYSEDSRFVNNLVSNGMVTADFAQSHQSVMLSIVLSELNCCKFDGDKHLFEVDLKVKEDAQPCEGDFFVAPGTISSPENPKGTVNVPVGDKDTPIGDSVPFFAEEINVELVSNPVKNYSTVTLNANGGAFANGEATYTEKVLIGSTADVDSFERPVKDNCEFVYWKDKDGQQIRYSVSVGFEDVVIYVMWAVHVPHKNFTTEEYEMNPDGKTYSLIKTGGSSGPVGGEVAFWPARIPEGFEVNTELSNWEGKIPEGDETLVLRIYYDRVKYKLTYNSDGKEIASYDVLYGAELADMPVPDAPEKEGHVFLGWDKEIPATMPAENLTFTAQWETCGYSIMYYEDENTLFASHGGSYGVAVPELKDIPEKEGYEFIGWDKEIPETFPAYNYKVYAVWKAKEYTVTWIVDGVETAETVTYGESITAPAVSAEDGYAFVGWDKEIPSTMPAESLTFTAVFEIYYLCPDCGDEFFGDEIDAHIVAEKRMKATVAIRNNPGSTSVAYGDSIKLTATVTDKPEDAKIFWYVNGEKKGEGESFTYTPEGNVEITVKLVDASGNPLKDSSGNEISDSEKVNVNAGFFQKIIAFFKKLFGLTKTIIQSYNRV